MVRIAVTQDGAFTVDEIEQVVTGDDTLSVDWPFPVEITPSRLVSGWM